MDLSRRLLQKFLSSDLRRPSVLRYASLSIRQDAFEHWHVPKETLFLIRRRVAWPSLYMEPGCFHYGAADVAAMLAGGVTPASAALIKMIRTASVRFRALTFWNTRRRCRRTVMFAIPSALAISLLLSPSTNSPATWISRWERLSARTRSAVVESTAVGGRGRSSQNLDLASDDVPDRLQQAATFNIFRDHACNTADKRSSRFLPSDETGKHDNRCIRKKLPDGDNRGVAACSRQAVASMTSIALS